MLEILFQNPTEFVLIFGGLIIAIGLHETAHCYMADFLGDPTPRSMGRTTLNPIAHLDPFGTLAILLTGFGWGKPAPFDPFNLKNPKSDTAKIAAAGPITNLVLALLLSLPVRFFDLPPAVAETLFFTAFLNVNLALFNLIPVAPLDGSKIVGIFMSHEQAIKYQNQTNLFLLMLLVIPIFGGQSLASFLISPFTSGLMRLLF